jgi:hypothetical protein
MATLSLKDVTLKVPSGLLMGVPNSSKGNGHRLYVNGKLEIVN